MKDKTFNRKQLYELVWTEPVIRLFKTFCIFDNGLREIGKSRVVMPSSF